MSKEELVKLTRVIINHLHWLKNNHNEKKIVKVAEILQIKTTV